MLPSEPHAALVDEVLQDDPDTINLASCTFEETLANVMSLRDAGAYVYVVPDPSDEVLTWRWVKRIPVETHRDKAITYQLGSDYMLLLDFHLQGPFETYSRPGYFKETRSVAADRVMAEWRGEYFPLSIDSNAVLVWSQETATWRFLKYASPYCGSVYPETIQR